MCATYIGRQKEEKLQKREKRENKEKYGAYI
jgi:hypothetical protein